MKVVYPELTYKASGPVVYCPGKIPYASRSDAEASIRRVVKRRPKTKKIGATGAYQCGACGAWHWGHRVEVRT